MTPSGSGWASRLGRMVVVIALVVASVVGTVSPVSGAATRPFPSVAFVARCGTIGERDDDPIITPGRSGLSHRHAFFGVRLATPALASADMISAQTTCDQVGDHAAYWVPAPVGDALRAYYDAGPLDPLSIRPYPTGMQLVAGNPAVWEPPGVGVVGWRCARAGDGPDMPGWTDRPPSPCGPGTSRAARLTFPQCWTGRSLSYRDVVAPVNGRCPADHPVAVPRLRVLVPVTAAMVSSGPLVTFHGDFLNGWSPEALEDLVRTCIRGQRASNVELKRCGLPGGR